jgi:hypothetical protein
MQKRSSDKATDASSAASSSSLALQEKMYEEQKALLQPWVDSGESNLNRLNTAMESGNYLDPEWSYTTEDWYNSPEYAVYNNARDASITQSQDAINASAAAKGLYGSGTWAQQLATNLGNQYAQYDTTSLAQAQNNAVANRTNSYNMLSGMANSSGTSQLSNAANNYGTNASNTLTAAGNTQAQNYLNQGNIWSNALNSGANQLSSLYGNYTGQQNYNALLSLLGNTGSSNVNPYGQVNNTGYALSY